MKIDTDLRLAIRSAEKAQSQDNWETKSAHRKESIAALLRLPKHAAKYKIACKQLQTSAKIRGLAAKFFDDLGINTALDHIHNDDRFAAAGGKMLPKKNVRWSFDIIMAQLVQAEPKEGAKILAKLGIKWK